MKKSILLFSTLLIAAWCHAQSLQLSSYSLSISGDKDSLLHANAVVHNVSGNSITIRVDRTIENLYTNHYSYFCWAGQCYGPPTSTSPFTTTLSPGDSSVAGPAGFIAYLNPAGTIGNSDITYCFYDDANAGDSVCITFNYYAIATGIKELIASGIALTSPFPNPANINTQIGFNLNNAKNAKLVLYNVLGSVVKEVKITEKQKLLTLSTQDLKNGVYIYSLLSDDKLIASKKLVVNHR